MSNHFPDSNCEKNFIKNTPQQSSTIELGVIEYRKAFQNYYLQQQFEEAHELTKNFMYSIPADEDLQKEILSNLELLGCYDTMRICLNQLLLLSPGNTEYLIKQGTIFLQLEETDRFITWAEKVLRQFPKNLRLYHFIVDNCIAYDKLTEAKKFAELGLKLGLEDLASTFERLKSISVQLTEEVDSSPDTIVMDYDEDSQVALFLSLFAGRENCYARQWVNDDGQYGYTLVKEPLTPNIVKNHLKGNITLGAYQLLLNNTVRWMVIDLDADKSVWEDLADTRYKQWLEGGFEQCYNSIKSQLDILNIPFYREFSGRKGYHLWFFFEGNIQAKEARLFGQTVASFVDVSGYPIKVEVFPKQSILRTDQVGNLVKLPFGIHRVTGVKSYFIDDDKQIIDPDFFMKNVKKIKPEQLNSAISSLNPFASYKEEKYSDKEINNSPIVEEKSYESIYPFSLDSDFEWQWLIKNCPTLNSIYSEILITHSLSKEKKTILIHSCGHLSHGVDVVNALLKLTSDSQPSDFLKSNLKGNPISCAKIRSYLGADLEMCNCDFSSVSSTYPNPLLHLSTISKPTQDINTLNELKIKNLVNHYLELKKQFNEIDAEFKKTEKQLLDLFEDIGSDELLTPWGKLVRKLENDKYIISLIF